MECNFGWDEMGSSGKFPSTSRSRSFHQAAGVFTRYLTTLDTSDRLDRIAAGNLTSLLRTLALLVPCLGYVVRVVFNRAVPVFTK